MHKACLGLGLALLLAGCGPSLAAPTPASTPGAAAALAAPAQSVVFDGDSYFMVDTTQYKGGGMLKEFLIDGETFEDCTRKITFRLTPGKDIRAAEKRVLAHYDNARPGYLQQVMYRSRKRLDQDFLFTDGEYQLWGWQLTPQGIEAFEMTIKMKNPAELKALVDKKRELWRKELQRMEKLAPSILK